MCQHHNVLDLLTVAWARSAYLGHFHSKRARNSERTTQNKNNQLTFMWDTCKPIGLRQILWPLIRRISGWQERARLLTCWQMQHILINLINLKFSGSKFLRCRAALWTPHKRDAPELIPDSHWIRWKSWTLSKSGRSGHHSASPAKSKYALLTSTTIHCGSLLRPRCIAVWNSPGYCKAIDCYVRSEMTVGRFDWCGLSSACQNISRRDS